jgi:hypothetical protein
MARRMSGNAIMASMMRAIGVSSPRKKPASRPRVTPTTDAKRTTDAPTRSDRRPA